MNMELNIGQKVAYPNQGVCLVENIEKKKIAGNSMNFYSLRVLSDNSTIFVPTANAENIGVRPIITSKQYKNLVNDLAKDFDDVSSDWKVRSREYNEKLQSGDVFEAADVLKKLTFLSQEKKLSFREQSLLEKAKFLIVSEVTNAGLADESKIEGKIQELIENACTKHHIAQPSVMSSTSH
ncbi:MAG: CarD family transcriptional regulator [Acidobacteriota bacterium]